MSINGTGPSGAELTLLHAKHKLSMGSDLAITEKLGAMGATFSTRRAEYGPVPADAKPANIPLPEDVKGAIANASS